MEHMLTSAYPCYLTVISKLLQHILAFNQIAKIPSDKKMSFRVKGYIKNNKEKLGKFLRLNHSVSHHNTFILK